MEFDDRERYNIPLRTNATEEVPIGFSADLWKFIMQRGNIPKRLEHLLRGDILLPDGKTWEASGTPMLNEKGIRWISNTVSNYVSIDKISTNITDEECNRICAESCLNIISKIYICHDEFEIQKSDMTPIVDMVDHFTLMSLASSRGATMLEFIKPTYRRTETVQPQQQKHWYSFLPFSGSNRS